MKQPSKSGVLAIRDDERHDGEDKDEDWWWVKLFGDDIERQKQGFIFLMLNYGVQLDKREWQKTSLQLHTHCSTSEILSTVSISLFDTRH